MKHTYFGDYCSNLVFLILSLIVDRTCLRSECIEWGLKTPHYCEFNLGDDFCVWILNEEWEMNDLKAELLLFSLSAYPS